MWKTAGWMAFAVIFLLTGCLPHLQPDEEENIGEEESMEDQEVEVSPEIPSLENNYRSILQDGQYIHSATRGFSTSVVYNRLDLDRLEVGLSEIASEQFDPSTYFFREGQFIDSNELNSWLMRYEEPSDEEEGGGNPYGLNPPLGQGDSFEEQERSQPRTLSYILEQNYVIRNEDDNLQLGGLAIGISMNSIYYFREQLEDGRYGPWYEEEIPEETSLEEGMKIANEVLERLRDEERENGLLNRVPIVFAIFRESPREAAVPGEFIATAVAKPGEGLNQWQTLNEKHYLFPSRTAQREQRADSEAFDQFKNDVNQFFENYVGVIGEGYYQNDELQAINIEIPVRFYGKGEIISFTQHVTDRMEARFPTELDIEISITSNNQPEALIVRERNDDPFVHIYH